MTAERGAGRPALVVAGACVIYAIVLAALGWDRYATYHSGADLGEFVQTIATPLTGETMMSGFTKRVSPPLKPSFKYQTSERTRGVVPIAGVSR